jgi:hypothetical protein
MNENIPPQKEYEPSAKQRHSVSRISGARPRPQGRLRRDLGWKNLLRSRTNAFTSFLEKKNTIELIVATLLGHAQTPGSASPSFGSTNFLRSRTNAFASFLEKKNIIELIVAALLGHAPDPRVGFAEI